MSCWILKSKNTDWRNYIDRMLSQWISNFENNTKLLGKDEDKKRFKTQVEQLLKQWKESWK
ncbi:hypothetical protein OVS_03965 [Mycoplasma ovis str. Michigan]|uniref:Uncharacterized protein n=1 Tax=Mycoplasma ovis str. Michigan TaxID=1415773 RepID=A0ABM5P2C0_9MOLU|nr:hypothetical protein OVS_03965 [Mycoplasma ovis str. Michigan]